MIHIYCGDGKGKTTAAVGLSMRMAGSGGKVLFIQFLKGSPTGETEPLKQLGITVMRCDREYGFWYSLDKEDREGLISCHNKNLAYAAEHMNEFDMIVLDELCAAYSLGAVDMAAARDFVEKCTAELVITGRDPDSFFTERADYISEIRKIKHPFDKGISARKGIEY